MLILFLCLVDGLSDIASAEGLFKAYQLHCLIGVGTCRLQIRTYRRNAQDSAAVCHNLSVCLPGSRMEHIVAVLILEVLQSVNGEALLLGHRITAGSQHHADCRVVLEFQIDLIQGAVHTGLEHIHNIRLHPGQDYLGLRVSEPRVVLHSSTRGPFGVSIRPKKMTPLNSLPSAAIASTVFW